MPTIGEVRAIRDRTNPVADWSDMTRLYPEAGHWVDEGWYYGALRHHDSVIREVDMKKLVGALLDRELNSA